MKNIRVAKFGRWAAASVAVTAIVFGVFVHAESAPAGLGIIVVDKGALFQESAAGQDIAKQLQEMRKSIGEDLNKKADKLKVEQDQLAGQQSLLTQDAFESKAKDLQQRGMALQREADEKNQQIQRGILTAQNKVWQAASPILEELLKEKQAVLMIDRAAVVKGSVDVDVTAAAIQRLNEKLPSVKVELVAAQKAAGQ